jgi:hypothetical protein
MITAEIQRLQWLDVLSADYFVAMDCVFSRGGYR